MNGFDYKDTEILNSTKDKMEQSSSQENNISRKIFDKNDEFFKNFANVLDSLNLDNIKKNVNQLYFDIKSPDKLFDFSLIQKYGIIPKLLIVSENDYENISTNAFELIFELFYKYINYNGIVNYYLDPSTGLLEFITRRFSQQFTEGTVNIRYLMLSAVFCHLICIDFPKFTDAFKNLGFLPLFTEYIHSSLNDKDLDDNDDGHASFNLMTEKKVLQTMNFLIINEKYNNSQEFENAINLYFRIFRTPKRTKLFKIACDLFIHYIPEDVKFIIILNDSETINYLLNLIEISKNKENNSFLKKAFELLAEVLSFQYNEITLEEDEDKESHQMSLYQYTIKVVHELATKINAETLLEYLCNDYESLDDEKYDEMYKNIIRLLNNVVSELDYVPNGIETGPLFEIVGQIFNLGRTEIKYEMMIFLLTVSFHASREQLIDILDSSYFDDILNDMGSSDEDIFDHFLDLVEKINTVYGRNGFESQNVSDKINLAFPGCINSAINNGLSKEQEFRARRALNYFYKDFLNENV